MSKKKKKVLETEEMRLQRIQMSSCTQTQVIPNKKKYKRKSKYKKDYKYESY